MPSSSSSSSAPLPPSLAAVVAAARAVAEAELLVRPEERGPRQFEYAMPDDCLRLVLYFTRAQDVARAAAVCRRWRRVGADELVWRRLSQRTMDRYLPEAPAAAAGDDGGEAEDAAEEAAEEAAAAAAAADGRGGGGGDADAAAHRRRAREARAAARRAALAERERLASARAEVVGHFRAEAKRLRSYRLAFTALPQVFETGLYCLREAYTRQGVSDMVRGRRARAARTQRPSAKRTAIGRRCLPPFLLLRARHCALAPGSSTCARTRRCAS
jgi:hypothetical protein